MENAGCEGGHGEGRRLFLFLLSSVVAPKEEFRNNIIVLVQIVRLFGQELLENRTSLLVKSKNCPKAHTRSYNSCLSLSLI